MSDQALSNSPAVLSTNPLWIAVCVAVIVHLVLMVGVQVDKLDPEQFSKSIDITLVNSPTAQAPEKAQMLAEENQQASGEQQQLNPQQPMPKVLPEKIKPVPQQKPLPMIAPEKVKPTPPPKPIQQPPVEKVKPMPIPQEKPEPKPVKEVESVIPKEQPFKADLPPVSKPDVEQKILTQDKAEQKITTRTHSTLNSQPDTHRHISAATLQQQIAEMGSEIRQAPPSVMETKTKNINQVSANKYVAAQYLKDWETKVERTGNNNYPAAATKAGFSATLTMDVAIKSDGSIDSMRITRSSGNPELDEQAKNIVRMSAPFPPLPTKLRSELDVLVITRSWKFSDESGLITQ